MRKRPVLKRLQSIAAPALMASLLIYLLYHTIDGDHGLIAKKRLEGEVVEARTTLEAVRTERERLEHRVGLLSGPRVDLDLLDERARHVLGLGGPDELVLFFKEPGRR